MLMGIMLLVARYFGIEGGYQRLSDNFTHLRTPRLKLAWLQYFRDCFDGTMQYMS